MASSPIHVDPRDLAVGAGRYRVVAERLIEEIGSAVAVVSASGGAGGDAATAIAFDGAWRRVAQAVADTGAALDRLGALLDHASGVYERTDRDVVGSRR